MTKRVMKYLPNRIRLSHLGSRLLGTLGDVSTDGSWIVGRSEAICITLFRCRCCFVIRKGPQGWLTYLPFAATPSVATQLGARFIKQLAGCYELQGFKGGNADHLRDQSDLQFACAN